MLVLMNEINKLTEIIMTKMYLDTGDTYTDENGATYSTSEDVDNTTTHEHDKTYENESTRDLSPMVSISLKEYDRLEEKQHYITDKSIIDIIDNLSPKLELLITNSPISNDNLQIENEVLKSINNEYQTFINEKISIIELCKTFNKELLSKLENMVFPNLDKLLTPHFSNIVTLNTNILLCDICNKFEASNNRSLNRHKSSCIKKHKQHVLNTTNDEIVIK